MKTNISKNAIVRIIKQSGAIRVSAKASEYLAEILEKKAIELSELAIKHAKFDGRKTIQKKDFENDLKD